MARPFPQITVIPEAEAAPARAEVKSVPAPRALSADRPEALTQVAHNDRNGRLNGHTEEAKPKDYFIERDGLRFAGQHLIVDMWQAERLDDAAYMEEAFKRAVEAAGATLLHIHVHTFSEGGGVSGVAVLAESHISVHTWPERDYAAFDVFMCGDAKPNKAVDVLREAFAPKLFSVAEHKRGIF